jgi:hypothetical protein
MNYNCHEELVGVRSQKSTAVEFRNFDTRGPVVQNPEDIEDASFSSVLQQLKKMESRVYDSVFDPVYTTHARLNRSSGKPLYRATPAAISGSQRSKFFRRPIVPFLHVRGFCCCCTCKDHFDP